MWCGKPLFNFDSTILDKKFQEEPMHYTADILFLPRHVLHHKTPLREASSRLGWIFCCTGGDICCTIFWIGVIKNMTEGHTIITTSPTGSS